nr:hypothetical protein [Sedimentibacter sp.]
MESVYFALKVYLLGFAASIFIAFIIKAILLVIRQFAKRKHA